MNRLLILLTASSLTADIIYVNPESNSIVRDGSSWVTGFSTLQQGLVQAQDGDQVYVIEGIHYPDEFQFTDTGNRSSSFPLETGVEVYGGFPAPFGSPFADRDPALYPTILSGDITQVDVFDQDRSMNSLHILIADGNRPGDGLLDGFIITGGYADGSTGDDDLGAGLICINGASPRIVNCLFEKNFATGGGGAVAVTNGKPVFENCRFEQNHTDGEGGAATLTTSLSATFSSCTFRANKADLGGAISCEGSAPTLEDCEFISNLATDSGGALLNQANSATSIINCTFQGNAAANEGGAIFNASSSPFLRNTIIWNNAADGDSGSSEASVAGTPDSLPFYFHSLVEGFSGTDSGSGNLNGKIASNQPRFLSIANPLEAPSLRGDSRILPGSPALNAGFNGIATAADRAGNTRIFGSHIDLGAFENQGFFYVRMDGVSGSNSGTSWPNAFFTIEEALTASPPGSVILVASGIYTPEVDTAAELDSTFMLKSGVAMLGGFPALGGDERNFIKNETRLSGEINSFNNSVARIVNATDTNAFTRLDGFTIGEALDTSQSQVTSGGLIGSQALFNLSNCVFQRNDADNTPGNQQGGAILLFNSQVTFFDCSFLANKAELGAAGSHQGTSAIYDGCDFRANTVRSIGGALHTDSTDLILRNCLFLNNISGTAGTGLVGGDSIYASRSHVEVEFCTFFNGVTSFVSRSSISFESCVNPFATVSANPLLQSSFIYNRCFVRTPDNFNLFGQGNFGNLSSFAPAPSLWPRSFGFIYADYRFLPNSPAFGMGGETFLLGRDLAGNPRKTGGLRDVGAYQGQGFLYVRAAATGANNGNSWTDAYLSLQDALAVAVPGQAILVGAGTYYPDDGGGETPGARTATFTLPSGVALVGGFPASGGETPDPAANLTILSGDIDQDGTLSGNSHHVVSAFDGDGLHTLLRGFTIRDGHADGSTSPADQGAGLLSQDFAAPQIVDCHFMENQATDSGGAVANLNASPGFFHCLFSSNHANLEGGAVINENDSAALFFSSIFRGNTSLNGGAVLNRNSNTIFLSSAFHGNRATNDGGGLFNQTSDPLLENCTIQGNWAAGGSGGGFANKNTSKPTFKNCLVHSNAVEQLTDVPEASMTNDSSSDPTFVACFVQGFFSSSLNESGSGSEGNFSSSPLITVNPNVPLFVNAASPFDAPTIEGDLRLFEDSFGLDQGFESTILWNLDAGGESRLQSESPNSSVDAVIDLGAYEGAVEVPVIAISLTDDDDGDGVPNGVELATGTLPAIADLADPAHLSLTDADPTNASISFGVDDALQVSLILKLTRSTDLMNFNVTIATNENTDFTVGSSGILTVNDPNPPTEKAFYRLEVLER